ncbi:hypothetical protein BDV34DRAFT_187384 [Aspergillus parasiticus]|uniref:Uncharacterized protein n=1 Tax=Aspergillus parasiticus TaxID=5067 RepID=A0A5N6DYX2_ASPPA|nr:hypothetical protein BDV34DRAFT_187384 [Aspergillus parasiticus]
MPNRLWSIRLTHPPSLSLNSVRHGRCVSPWPALSGRSRFWLVCDAEVLTKFASGCALHRSRPLYPESVNSEFTDPRKYYKSPPFLPRFPCFHPSMAQKQTRQSAELTEALGHGMRVPRKILTGNIRINNIPVINNRSTLRCLLSFLIGNSLNLDTRNFIWPLIPGLLHRVA